MKPAAIEDIKQELSQLPPKKVLELCLRLARYKKENKEFLTYLLFEADDVQGYIANVKSEVDELFQELPKATKYQNYKALRKILRLISKYSKHTSSKQAEVEMLIHFCQKVKGSGISIYKSPALTRLYVQQVKNITALVQSLHEDLHRDYKVQLDELA
jgi:hypothetical protein